MMIYFKYWCFKLNRFVSFVAYELLCNQVSLHITSQHFLCRVQIGKICIGCPIKLMIFSRPFPLMSLQLLASGYAACPCFQSHVNSATCEVACLIIHRDCDVSYNCNDPDSQSECNVLMLMRNNVLLLFLFVKIKTFWLIGKIWGFMIQRIQNQRLFYWQ